MLIQTELLQPDGKYEGKFQSPADNNQTYCGLDCCLTYEIREQLASLPQPEKIYSFERALQGPYMEIMQRGFLVDELSRRQAAEALRVRLGHLQLMLDDFARATWGRPLNPRSPKQLQEFFYGAMKLPEVWISQKGVRKLSTNREALEKLEDYLYARPFINIILSIREIGKQLDVFEGSIDSDGRFRAGYNIAGTETGRPSSSENAFGTASNAQNIAQNLRFVFVADPDMRMCVVDLEQVEARDVGFFIGCLFNDWTFLDNCEAGDLHTNNSKLVWRDLRWTGDKKADRLIADRIFYRDFSYRDMSKRGGHLSNYFGTAFTMSRSLKIPLAVAEEFQARYVRGRPRSALGPAIEPAFPGIAKWWQWTAEQLQTLHMLETPFGRRRHFFGRPNDDTTLREAIAFLPQSTTADRMNLGLWRVWKAMPQVQLLAQTYDSITFQYSDKLDEREIIEEVLRLIRVELTAPNGRKYIVPGEAKVGWNWGSRVSQEDIQKTVEWNRANFNQMRKLPRFNPDGLIKWSKATPDRRERAIGIKRRML